MKSNSRPFGFNLIGHASASAGLGVALRSLAKTILDRGHPVAILDVDAGHWRAGHDLSLGPYLVESAKELPYSINISTLSITSLPNFIFDYPELFTEETLNIGYFWWELSTLPEQWKKSLEIFDVLLAGSDFLYATYSQTVEDVFHIRIIPKLTFPSEVQAGREQFGIDSDAFVFICILEPTSDPIRKNPFSAIAAFQQAFIANENVRLIVKINNHSAFATDDKNLVWLREAAKADSRIRLFTESLSYVGALNLYASCDVYVALHRSEGLGLGLMEAMLLGKPVIATSWSGNMSFMDHTNACLVRYQLIPVKGSLAVYTVSYLGQSAHWAEPSIGDATAWMKSLFLDADLTRQIGETAKTAINLHLNHEETSKWLDEIILIWNRAKTISPLSSSDTLQNKACLKKALLRRNLSRGKRIRARLHELLERHLFWRLRSTIHVAEPGKENNAER